MTNPVEIHSIQLESGRASIWTLKSMFVYLKYVNFITPTYFIGERLAFNVADLLRNTKEIPTKR